MDHQITFNSDRTTTNTVRFGEDVPDSGAQKMGTIYLSNAFLKELGADDPKKVKSVRIAVIEVIT